MKPIQNNPAEVSGKGDGDCLLLPVGIPKGPVHIGNGLGADYGILRGGELCRLTSQQLIVWNECWKLARMKELVLDAAASLSIIQNDIKKAIEELIKAIPQRKSQGAHEVQRKELCLPSLKLQSFNDFYRVCPRWLDQDFRRLRHIRTANRIALK